MKPARCQPEDAIPKRGRKGELRRSRTRPARRKTFKQAVSMAVLARLDEAIRQDGRSPEHLAALYESLALEREFGVTLAQLRRYAGGVEMATPPPPAPTPVDTEGQDIGASNRSTDSKGTDTGSPQLVTAPAATPLDREAFHTRMKAIGQIVDSTFGAVATHQPDLWGHGAYLMVVGSVVACLAERHAELSTSELATLSKILAEQRSLTLKQAESDRKLADQQRKAASDSSAMEGSGNGDTRTRELPAHFGDVVRQIYGTSFQDDFTVDSGATGGLSAGAEPGDVPAETPVGKPSVARGG